MDATPPFSERHGFTSPPAPITIRYEAPPILREGILAIAEKSNFGAGEIRSIICSVLDELPDVGNNWSYPNVMSECKGHIHKCEWFEVYDICEAIAREAALSERHKDFEKNLNRFFEKKGIGWKIESGQLSVRGEEDYERTVAEAQTSLEESGRQTAAGELKEALRDISRRPEPEVTGAVQHSMAALECLAKDISGGPSKTLGDLIGGLNLPSPVDQAVHKMYGFASNQGRHVREGGKPDFPEAMLTVHFSSSLISYLTIKHK